MVAPGMASAGDLADAGARRPGRRHAGEVELEGDGVSGIAVHIGARISSLAEPGQVLVSSTVKDLVAGSGISFRPRGRHALKGVPEEWDLFEVKGT
jgi:class 3 adenylate cyclase